jgi:2-polyprenyl-3-methyl-5-hydroxy-6-metoxy-1,4-benzoquinol methylase
VNNAYFLKAALNAKRKHRGLPELDAMDFMALVRQKANILHLDPSLLTRPVNEGFSGGEKKRNEIFQMAVLEPRLAILDETDSGLDIDALKAVGVEGRSLLDIGGGVGAIQYALLSAGVEQAVSVDASAGYTAVAQKEAEAQGFGERITHLHGNFVDVAPQLEPADIVTLDRVLCCYDDMPALVAASARLAKGLYGVVFPRDTWWIKLGLAVMSFFMRVFRHPMGFFAHSTEQIEALLREHGLVRRYYRRNLVWQVIVYERAGAG